MCRQRKLRNALNVLFSHTQHTCHVMSSHSRYTVSKRYGYLLVKSIWPNPLCLPVSLSIARRTKVEERKVVVVRQYEVLLIIISFKRKIRTLFEFAEKAMTALSVTTDDMCSLL